MNKRRIQNNPRKRCSICGKWYEPDKRTRKHQICCGKASCREERKARANKSWRIRNPGYEKYRRLKIRDWSKSYPDYWSYYRQAHSEYVQRDNRRRKASRERAKNAAKQDAIRQMSVEKLMSIPRFELGNAAKQDVMDRRVDEVVECLLGLICAAKQAGIGVLPRGMP